MHKLASKTARKNNASNVSRSKSVHSIPKPGTSTSDVLFLQRTIGNQKVLKIMRSRHKNTSKDLTVTPELEMEIHRLQSGGQPLPRTERSYFEPRFGKDFSNVRIHTGRAAARAARLTGARAFTMGRDVVFAPGEYAPSTGTGRQLLAHELTHVVQQRRGLTHPGTANSAASDNCLQCAPGGGSGPACKVKSFKLKVNKWSKAWPGGSGFYTLQLPVDFELELNSNKSDCLIGQDKMGQVEYHHFKNMGGINIPIIKTRKNVFSSWTRDGNPAWPNRYWWDGKKANYKPVSWNWFSEGASFNDAPGFARAVGRIGPFWGFKGIDNNSFPIYYGGVGKTGHFKFRTYIKDASTKATVRELNWGLLIDYTSPTKGKEYFYT